MTIKEKQEYMKVALGLASKANEKTYPNPMVGAVIVKNGSIIGRGYHKEAGSDHAEVAAIKNASVSCRGAVMFVTLEPCDTYGRTPPCTKAIIESGIKKVIIAMSDPNPVNAKKGTRRLKRAGIDVETGICGDEAAFLNRKYIKYIMTGLPYVTVKLAQSIDGKIAARDGSSKWISSSVSRKYVKKMRKNFDAVVVGSNTALKDDPFLLDEDMGGYNVKRVVIDTSFKLSFRSNLVRTSELAPLLVCTTEMADMDKVVKFNNIEGVEVMVLRSNKGKVPLATFLKKMASRGMINILVEGGGELVGSLVDEYMVDEMLFFISPTVMGGPFSSIKGKGVPNIERSLKFKHLESSSSGGDIFIKGIIDKG